MVGVIIFAIIAIALFIASAVVFNGPAEWWNGAMLIFFGVIALLGAIMKLMDIRENSSKVRYKRRKITCDDIVKYTAEYDEQKHTMDIVSMYVKAYKVRKLGLGLTKSLAVSSITKSFKELLSNWEIIYETPGLGKKTKEEFKTFDEFKERLFKALESEFAVLSSNGTTEDIYEVYRSVFLNLDRDYKSKEELKKIDKDLSVKGYDKGRIEADFIYLNARPVLRAGVYKRLAQGFCYLNLLDNAITELDYYLVKATFFDERDDAPFTWVYFETRYDNTIKNVK